MIERIWTILNRKKLAILSNHQPGEIAKNRRELNKETKVYIGPLFPHIFKDYPNLIHTSYSDGEIRRESIEIGVKSVEQLKIELNHKHMQVGGTAKQMIENFKVTPSESPKVVTLISLTIGDMGFTTYKEPTTEQLYKRAEELGLEPCSLLVALELRLKDQPFFEQKYVATESITGSNDHPNIFQLEYHDGLWLSEADSNRYWNLSDRVVFCLPNQS
jgi:hypothetical protein